MLRRRPLVPWLLLAGLVALLIGLVAVMRARSDDDDHGAALALYGLQQREGKAKQKGENEGGSRHGAGERELGEPAGEAEREEEQAAKAGGRNPKEAAATIEGRKGGEGERHGAKTPWAEQVGNRAYPRGYVDDRRARAGRRAFDRAPASAPRSAFRTKRAYRAALAAEPGKWTGLGPVTPNVAGEASQFFDPVTQEGPPTQESAASPRSPSTRRALLPPTSAACGWQRRAAASGGRPTRWPCIRSGRPRRMTCRPRRSGRSSTTPRTRRCTPAPASPTGR